METREIVALANSYKEGGYCLAGKDIYTKEWIRPVSDQNGGSLGILSKNSAYGNIKPLDLLELTLSRDVPTLSQPENKILSSINSKKTTFDRAKLSELVDNPSNIWLYGDKQDRVSSVRFGGRNLGHTSSLYLIHARTIEFVVGLNYIGGKKLLARFYYNNFRYEFSVTDTSYCKYKQNEAGYTFVEYDKYLCISLGVEFKGYHYKLVASII